MIFNNFRYMLPKPGGTDPFLTFIANAENTTNVTENSFYLSKKAPLQVPRFSTCKASKHVKYESYNTLESKQVPKSTVKITLPLLEMWRRKKKKKNKGKE